MRITKASMSQQRKNARMYRVLGQAIILIWASWITVVSCTDFCNLLVGFGFLPENHAASSHNLDLIMRLLMHYNLNYPKLALALFTMVNLWVFVIALAYWRTFVSFFTNREQYVYRAMWAFLINMTLFMLFLVNDEIFIQYAFGHSHMNFLVFIFTSLYLFLYLNKLAVSNATDTP